jgi:hypothetical protein
VEKEDLPPYKVDNTAFYVFISNNKDSYKIQEDRRYFILHCSDKYCDNKEYFDVLFEELEKKECGDHLYTYLANERDISKLTRMREPHVAYREQKYKQVNNFITNIIKTPKQSPTSAIVTKQSKGIKVILALLQELQILHTTEVNFNIFCRYYKPLPFDVMVILQGKKVGLFEYDGQQHFECGSMFTKTEDDLINQQTRDVIKTHFAKNHGISLLRISYDMDESQIKKHVMDFLHQCKKRIQPVYLFSNPILYAEHQSICQL